MYQRRSKKYQPNSKTIKQNPTNLAAPGGKNKKTGVALEVDCQKKSFIIN